MRGRVVDRTSLENWQTLTGHVGSNPTASAKFCNAHMVELVDTMVLEAIAESVGVRVSLWAP